MSSNHQDNGQTAILLEHFQTECQSQTATAIAASHNNQRQPLTQHSSAEALRPPPVQKEKVELIWMRALSTAEQQQASMTKCGTFLYGVPLADH